MAYMDDINITATSREGVMRLTHDVLAILDLEGLVIQRLSRILTQSDSILPETFLCWNSNSTMTLVSSCLIDLDEKFEIFDAKAERIIHTDEP